MGSEMRKSPKAIHDAALSAPLKLDLAANFKVDAQELATGRTCIIAQSGAGKSYTVAVMCELMLGAGVPFCVVDTEGEYFSLKQKFELLWVGGEDADVRISDVDLNELARRAISGAVPLIFDVSESSDQPAVVSAFCKALYDAETELRKPYLLIIEEADKFVPQARPNAASAAVEEIARRGRKRGLGLLLATQRPALISKSALSQCGNQLIGKLTTEADLAAVSLFFPSRKDLEELPKLGVGEFFAMGNLSRQRVKFRARPRETAHTGLTPKLVPKPAQKISELAERLSSSSRCAPAPKISDAVQNAGRSSLSNNGASGARAIEPAVSREAALSIAESRKRARFGIFGEKENMTSFDLIWRPLVYAEVARPEGLLRKRIATVSFILDCKSGRFADVKNGLSLKPSGLESILGLSEGALRALFAIKAKPGITLADLEAQTSLSESGLRDAVDELRKRMLVTWNKVKNVNRYFLLSEIRVPKLDRRAVMPELRSRASKAEELAFGQNELRAVVKALNRQSDVTRFEVFYYPLYCAHLRNKSSRVLWIDGVTGKEVELD